MGLVCEEQHGAVGWSLVRPGLVARLGSVCQGSWEGWEQVLAPSVFQMSSQLLCG